MESKALVKSTKINVACRFFARTPSRILRMIHDLTNINHPYRHIYIYIYIERERERERERAHQIFRTTILRAITFFYLFFTLLVRWIKSDIRLTQHMKKHSVAVALKTYHSDAEMVRFLKVKVRNELVNQRNERWFYWDTNKVLTVMHTKFPSIVLVLRVVDNERDVTSRHFCHGD